MLRKYKPNTIEEIYPLTIVAMRYGSKFAIIEANCDATCVRSLEGDEEVSYDPHKFMKDEWSHINYGIGETISIAFENFQYNKICSNKQ